MRRGRIERLLQVNAWMEQYGMRIEV